MEDCQPSIGVFVDAHACLDVVMLVPVFEDLQNPCLVMHRIVITDHTLLLDAEDILQGAGKRNKSHHLCGNFHAGANRRDKTLEGKALYGLRKLKTLRHDLICAEADPVKTVAAVSPTSPGASAGYGPSNTCDANLAYDYRKLKLKFSLWPLVRSTHTWLSEKQPWVRIPDGLPQFQRMPG